MPSANNAINLTVTPNAPAARLVAVQVVPDDSNDRELSQVRAKAGPEAIPDAGRVVSSSDVQEKTSDGV